MNISLETAKILFREANDWNQGRQKYIAVDSPLRELTKQIGYSDNVSTIMAVTSEIFRVIAEHYMEQQRQTLGEKSEKEKAFESAQRRANLEKVNFEVWEHVGRSGHPDGDIPARHSFRVQPEKFGDLADDWAMVGIAEPEAVRG